MLLEIWTYSGEVSGGNKEYVIGNWRKDDPHCRKWRIPMRNDQQGFWELCISRNTASSPSKEQRWDEMKEEWRWGHIFRVWTNRILVPKSKAITQDRASLAGPGKAWNWGQLLYYYDVSYIKYHRSLYPLSNAKKKVASCIFSILIAV